MLYDCFRQPIAITKYIFFNQRNVLNMSYERHQIAAAKGEKAWHSAETTATQTAAILSAF